MLLSILEAERVALYSVTLQQNNGWEGPFIVVLTLPSFQVILREISLSNQSQWSRHMVKNTKRSKYQSSFIKTTFH